MRIEIMDTTLRDGEQTSGVSFVTQEKLNIARMLLEELKVNRIEIASARVSSGELAAAREVCQWAARTGHIDQVEVLGFVDDGASIEWIESAGGRVMNLLSKGSLNHCTGQLGKSAEEHWADVKRNIAMARERGISVNLYLEDWSSGMINSPAYAFEMLDAMASEPIERFMLPDTLGILNPYQTFEFCYKVVRRYPQLHFDFHPHNDYDFAVANAFAAAKTGVKGIHCTVNGIGERAGNAPLSSVVAVLHDQLKATTSIVESRINYVSRVVESFSGVRIPGNKPIIGELVFTQCAGIHADGDAKSNLYFNDLLPERFGRTREYALGKSSGKANIRKNLDALNIELSEDAMRRVTQRIIELGDKKERVTQSDLPYIISDVLNSDSMEANVRLLHYTVTLSQGLHPMAVVKLAIGEDEYETSAMGAGQYDAFVKAIRKIYREHRGEELPLLTNYTVDIPPGGRTDAFVQTIITWEYEGQSLKTRGLNADQTQAAVEATIKMLNQVYK